MSWRRGIDGDVEDGDDDSPEERATLVVRGVRHRLVTPVKKLPPAGGHVEFKCGIRHTVLPKYRNHHVYDCSACAEIHAEEMRQEVREAC